MFNQNPFFYNMPTAQMGNMLSPAMGTNGGLLGGIGSAFKKIGWGGLLTNTQKTLNVVNQAIPIYNQMKPMFKNAKTIFRVVNEINKGNNKSVDIKPNINDTTNNPQFFA